MKLGKIQAQVLDTLKQRGGHWNTEKHSWVWTTAAKTEDILMALARRGLVSVSHHFDTPMIGGRVCQVASSITFNVIKEHKRKPTQVEEAFMFLMDGRNAGDVRRDTGLTEKRCKEIYDLYLQLQRETE